MTDLQSVLTFSGRDERPYRIALSTPVWDTVSSLFLYDWSRLIADVNGPKGEWAEWSMQVTSGSLLPIVRNRMMLGLANLRTALTHVIMIDSDVLGLTVEHVERLVKHDVPIVAPLVCLRGGEHRPACESEDGYGAVYDELKRDGPGLVRRKWVGMGCICIKWGVLEDMQIPCPGEDGGESRDWFRTANIERPDWKRDWQECVNSCVSRVPDALEAPEDEVPGKLAELFTESWIHGRQIWNGGSQAGEDVEFGLRAAARGYESYLDCGIQLRHLGEKEVSIADHLDAIGRGEVAKR